MNDFGSVLLRLKGQVHLHADKEIAALLGLSDKAFHARKTRSAFPADKLFALAAKRPELNIDVNYVLNGKRSEPSVMAAISKAGSRVQVIRGTRTQQEFAEALGISSDHLEQVEAGDQWLDKDLHQRLVEQEHVSPMWLLSGEVPPLDGEITPLEVLLIHGYRACTAAQQAEIRREVAKQVAQVGNDEPSKPMAFPLDGIHTQKPRK